MSVLQRSRLFQRDSVQRAGNKCRYEVPHSQTYLNTVLMSTHEAETSSPCLSCFNCTRAVSRSYITLHFQLICRYFRHSKHYASFRNGWWPSQDELFLQISTEVWDLGLGCCRTYQRTPYHTNTQNHPGGADRGREQMNQTGDEGGMFFSHSLPLLSHGLLFYFYAPLLLLFSSSPLCLDCMAWPKPIKIALLEGVERERERGEGDHNKHWFSCFT